MRFFGFLRLKNKMRTYAEIIKDLSPYYFHGNVRAQLGRIIYKEDVEIRRKKISKYVF
jgi:hypothetical protein